MVDEATKQKFRRAQELCNRKRFQEAWDLLEYLQKAVPNSRQLTYQRAICLAGLKRLDEARALSKSLEGKLDVKYLNALKAKIAEAEESDDDNTPAHAKMTLIQAPSVSKPTQPVAPAAARPAAPPVAPKPRAAASGGKPAAKQASNVFMITATYPLSTEETSVTGHVASGAFYTGDTVSLVSPTGLPLIAPIIRLGSAETPLKMIRQGQQGSMVLQVEPHHVVPGSRLTSAASSSSHADTMVMAAGGAASGAPARADALDSFLQDAEGLLNERRAGEAYQRLVRHVDADSGNFHAHRLLARVYLESDLELRDNRRALDHAKKAFELGGHADPGVLEVLANALGANGEPTHGLRHLERVYSMTEDAQDRDALGKRIQAYRTRYRLGDIWQFADGFGNVIYESDKTEEVKKALINKVVPKEAMCRKNRLGEWQPIEELLAVEEPDIAALFHKGPQQTYVNAGIGFGLGFVVVFILMLLFAGSGIGNVFVVSLLCGGLTALIGFALAIFNAGKQQVKV